MARRNSPIFVNAEPTVQTKEEATFSVNQELLALSKDKEGIVSQINSLHNSLKDKQEESDREIKKIQHLKDEFITEEEKLRVIIEGRKQEEEKILRLKKESAELLDSINNSRLSEKDRKDAFEKSLVVTEEESRNVVVGLENKAKRINDDIIKLNLEKTGLQAQNEKLILELQKRDSLSETIIKLEADIKRLASEKSVKQEEIDIIKKEISELNREKCQIEIDVVPLRATIASLRIEADKLALDVKEKGGALKVINSMLERNLNNKQLQKLKEIIG